MTAAVNAGRGADDREITTRKVVIAMTCLLGSTFIPYVQAIIGPLMMLPMTAEFGWTRTSFAFAMTFFFVIGSITVLVFGRLADRFGPRLILLLGAGVGGATMLLLSTQDGQLWRLYLAFGLLGAFGSSGVGYTKIIGALFSRHRGKALALFGAESTLAIAALPLLTNGLNVHGGWRRTYVVYAMIMFLLMPVLYFTLRGPGISRRPDEPAVSTGTQARDTGLAPAQFRRDPRFWLIIISAMLGGGFNGGFTAHVIAAIVDKGFSTTAAAGILSTATFLALAGTLSAGFVMDHFRSARVLVFAGILAAAGAAVLASASATFGGAFVVILGLSMHRAAMQGLMPGTIYVLTRFVGMSSFGEAYATQVFMQGIVMGLASPFFGLLNERWGSYAPMYAILVGSAIACGAIFPLLGAYRFGAARREPAAEAGNTPVTNLPA